MSATRTKFVAILVVLFVGSFAANAMAQYCANYSDGSQSCGIPTFQMCLQTVSGVGGSCGPDNTSQMRPNLMQRMFNQQQLYPPAVQNPDPMMPPPPSRN